MNIVLLELCSGIPHKFNHILSIFLEIKQPKQQQKKLSTGGQIIKKNTNNIKKGYQLRVKLNKNNNKNLLLGTEL